MGAADRPITRGLPTHFVTLWMVDLPSHHGGRPGDLGWAVLWTAAAVLVAWILAATRIGPLVRRRNLARSGSTTAQGAAAARAVWSDARRNPAQCALFVVVPVVFIITADAVNPNEPIFLTLREHGTNVVSNFAMPAVHGATMAPIAVASLSAIVGLFVLLDSRAGDQRVALAGLRGGVLLTARLGVLAALALAATTVSLTATALVFDATRWPTYAAANVLLGFTYGLIGALLAPLFGRVGGVFVAFLLPFIDIGIVQSPMLHPESTGFSRLLPGYGGSRVLLDGALTRGFDETGPLLMGLAWLTALAIVVALTCRGAVQAPSHKNRIAQLSSSGGGRASSRLFRRHSGGLPDAGDGPMDTARVTPPARLK